MTFKMLYVPLPENTILEFHVFHECGDSEYKLLRYFKVSNHNTENNKVGGIQIKKPQQCCNCCGGGGNQNTIPSFKCTIPSELERISDLDG